MNRSLLSSSQRVVFGFLLGLAPMAFLSSSMFCVAQQAGPDVLVLNDGNVLHGKLVKELDGKVTFHTDALGDVSVAWNKVKELHVAEKFAVLDKTVKLHGKKPVGQIPVGPVDVENQTVQVHAGNAPASIPVSNAAFIVDQETLNQQISHQPSFFAGWNGAATAGATIVTATQNQYTASGSIGLIRAIPGVTWLNPRSRTSMDFSGSYGKISQPGTPAVKTSIYRADAEQDEYFSDRFFGLAQVAFDHNFAQGLALQSVFGGGIGFTAFSTPKHQLDLKATIQYESQQFIASPGAVGASPSHNLIGSTFSANYLAKWKLATYTQELAFVPAYNVPSAYSANETNALSFPVYKNFGFSIGTLDSYLNDPPISVPPTKRNSFQFTMGLTYAFKSKY